MNEELYIDLNVLTAEPADEYHAKAGQYLSSHQLIDFMKSPWLYRKKQLGMIPDGILTADDLGSAHGPLMAPQTWSAVFKPQVARLGAFLRQHGIDFWLHSDGAVGLLIDDFVDAGVQVLNPLEVKAGMDVVELRRRYGKRLAFYGNIDATKMAGPQETIVTELRRKIPIACQGGYVFHSDHSCPPGVSLERYRWILETARAIFAEGGQT